MRYRFNDIFTENQDGTLTPTRQIRVGGVTFGPGVVFGASAAFGGINFHQYRGRDLEAVEDKKNVLVIKAIY